MGAQFDQYNRLKNDMRLLTYYLTWNVGIKYLYTL